MSQTQSTHDRVCAIVADICGIPIGNIDPGADLLVTYLFDELDFVELAVNLEDEFKIALMTTWRPAEPFRRPWPWSTACVRGRNADQCMDAGRAHRPAGRLLHLPQ
jgi:acyl carrier protein